MMDFRVVGHEEQAKILGEHPRKLEWGWYMPEESPAGVSARMIAENGCLAYLRDRVSRIGANAELDQAAAEKCIEIKLAENLYSFMQDNGICSDSEKIIFGEMPGYQMLATPNASYGYVYMSFWAV